VADPPDDDLVVAAGQAVLDGAFQHRQHAVDPGGAGRPVPVPDLFPRGGQAAAGEVRRQLPLPRREHVDDERAMLPDSLQGQAAEVEADQDQRRIQRQ
jgi:hypothetical protein